MKNKRLKELNDCFYVPPCGPQSEMLAEIPIPTEMLAATASKATVRESKAEAKTAPPVEEEKEAVLPIEVPTEITAELEPAPIETPTVTQALLTPELKMTSEPAPESAPEPTPEASSTQTTIKPQSGDMTYVEGFVWMESQGPTHVEYTEDMYENGCKIGSMDRHRFRRSLIYPKNSFFMDDRSRFMRYASKAL